MIPHALPQVLTVTLNPAVDHTIETDNLTLGAVNRARSMREDVGGKGLNVASCLADYGVAVQVTGQLGRANAALFETLFQAKGLRNTFAYRDGLTRINTKLVDPVHGVTTDINMPGAWHDGEMALALRAQIETVFEQAIPACSWVVLAGSLPPGLAAETYACLAAAARRRGASVLVDASGSALAHAMTASVDVVKPNRAELAELCGALPESPAAMVSLARSLITQAGGPRQIVVSLGAEGALFVTAENAVRASALSVVPRSLVGAGDAMVAGVVAAKLAGLALVEEARLATAFAAAKLGHNGPHLGNADVVRALAEQVQVDPLG